MSMSINFRRLTNKFVLVYKWVLAVTATVALLSSRGQLIYYLEQLWIVKRKWTAAKCSVFVFDHGGT